MSNDDAGAFAITYIGGPTALIEVGGLRLLTDPTFDAPGKRYHFGWGTMSRKLQGPAVAAAELGRIDAVLLSHDHHDDNLDAAGRELLPSAGRVLTTPAGAKRLGGNASGLAPWESTTLSAPSGLEVRVTATPARHGPPLSRPLVGEVIGFVLEWEGQRHGAVWISGDTVYFRGVAELRDRFHIGTAIVHLGGVRFPVTGPARYTMNAAEAARVTRELGVRTLVPIHYEGWKHFRQGRDAVERTFQAEEVAERVRWLQAAQPATIEV
ncbi:MAG TPA: MBL fold metallo-hydrolase [Solirubrobacteraceae bacterium]|nr:MBL fold metallo-hydrolase [Solirubrobacteraceae bacterium]